MGAGSQLKQAIVCGLGRGYDALDTAIRLRIDLIVRDPWQPHNELRIVSYEDGLSAKADYDSKAIVNL